MLVQIKRAYNQKGDSYGGQYMNSKLIRFWPYLITRHKWVKLYHYIPMFIL